MFQPVLEKNGGALARTAAGDEIINHILQSPSGHRGISLEHDVLTSASLRAWDRCFCLKVIMEASCYAIQRPVYN